jgi:AcrR family transcriptional regulator
MTLQHHPAQIKTSTPSKQAAILTAALELFALEGIPHTPTSRIAQHAGVATGTLFHHFESKELLINTLYLQVKAQVATALQTGLEACPNTQTKIKQLWLNSLYRAIQNPSEYRFLLECQNSNSITPDTLDKGMADTLFMLELVERGKLEGILKNVPNALLGEMHFALCQAASRYFLKNPALLEDAVALEGAFGMYWDAVGR